MRYSLSAGYGLQLSAQLAAAVGPVMGQILIVHEDSDNAAVKDMMTELAVPDPDGRVRFFTTLEAAYAAATSNANDIILMSAQSSHSLASGIAWSKSRIHVIGMDGGDRLLQQGTKITSSSTDDTGYVLKVTGTRNSFRNLKFIQNSTDAAAITVVQDGGEGTVWKNCSFTFGVADNLDGATTYEFVAGTDSGTFLNCTFGSDTLTTSAARAVFAMDVVTSGQEYKSNVMRDCIFQIQSSDADANFMRVLATTDVKFTNLFERCSFIAAINSTASAVTLTDAVDSVSGLVEGNLLFVDPASNCTNFCSAVTDNVKVVGSGVASQAAFIGVGVVPS